MQQKPHDTRRILGILAFGIVLFVGLWHLNVVLSALQYVLRTISFFTVGLCIAFILNTPLKLIETRLFAPLNRRFTKRWPRVRRPVALVLTLLLLLGLIFLAVFLVIPEMVRTITMLAEEAPAFFRTAAEWVQAQPFWSGEAGVLDRLLAIDWNEIGKTALEMLRGGAGTFLTGTFSAASSVVSAVVSLILGLILAVYVLSSKEKLAGQSRRILYAYLPERRADHALHVGTLANRIFSNFITGQFFEALILGVLCFIGMTIFRFPYALMVSVLVGITAFIPIFGAFIGGLVGSFMILVNQGLLPMVWFIVFFLVLQQVEGNLFYPHVVGKSVMLPGLWVLVAVTIGGNVGGIAGMLISVPLCSLLYALLREAVGQRGARLGIDPAKLQPGGPPDVPAE